MLDIKHLSKTFFPGTVNEKRALYDVNLHMEPGDFITIIGGNGAGKSTLLNSIVYRLVIALVLQLGMPPNDLKLFTAVLVALALSLPMFKGKLLGRKVGQ